MATTLQLEVVELPADYERIATSLMERFQRLPPLPDLDVLYSELARLGVPSNAVNTYQSLSQDLEKVSSYCTRATEIYIQVFRHSQMLEAMADLLESGWVKFSHEKNEAARRGDASLRTAQLRASATEVTSVVKAAERVIRNLESRHKALSEELECLSRMMRLGESNVQTENAWNRREPDLPGESEMFDPAPTPQ